MEQYPANLYEWIKRLYYTSHLYPPPPRDRRIAGLLTSQSPAKSPALRGQICGKIPAKYPRLPGG